MPKPTRRVAKPPADKTGYAVPPPPGKGEFKSARVALVMTRWNVGIVESLHAGVRACLKDWGVADKHVGEFYAPGAFELPLAASELMKSGEWDAVVTLGAVIRGDTPHFDFVAGECSRGLREAAQKHGVPLGFGVLTVNTAQQAVDRAGPGKDNKGYEAAAAALEMLRLVRAIHV